MKHLVFQCSLTIAPAHWLNDYVFWDEGVGTEPRYVEKTSKASVFVAEISFSAGMELGVLEYDC